MICQECNQRPATLHFTKVVNGAKTEVHLCEKCAQEKGEMFMLSSAAGFSINNLLAGLLNIDPSFHTTKQNSFQNDSDLIRCQNCSMSFEQFVKVGRFGCGQCYESFNDHLTPILKRLHSGNTNHIGKVPKKAGGTIIIQKQLEKLKEKLLELISSEEFEKAAEVRDEIRSLEKKVSSQGGGMV